MAILVLRIDNAKRNRNMLGKFISRERKQIKKKKGSELRNLDGAFSIINVKICRRKKSLFTYDVFVTFVLFVLFT